ncbi:hypothetical protein LAZ67_22001635 [Cordylochernes scorpioides]|uniref:Uncharacterized protein n=1 Tax=Cordylochernes scorpioides TaxID=51811 RepID=A0ABY6LRI8_9ARAC|nr:hypothetical protein LAZ67_22001635 [Cordylochernes scorpioides]
MPLEDLHDLVKSTTLKVQKQTTVQNNKHLSKLTHWKQKYDFPDVPDSKSAAPPKIINIFTTRLPEREEKLLELGLQDVCVGHLSGKFPRHSNHHTCPIYHNTTAEDCQKQVLLREQKKIDKQKKMEKTAAGKFGLRKQVQGKKVGFEFSNAIWAGSSKSADDFSCAC